MLRNGRLGLGTVLILSIGAIPAVASRDGDGPQESWDAAYIQNKRVGYFHTQVIPVKDNARELRRVMIDMSLSFKRAGDSVTLETLYGTIETPEGEVLRLDSRTLVSKQEMRIAGDVVDGKMNLTLSGSGQDQKKTIPWGPDVRGPYGAEMSMARKPLQPGESRQVKVFIPDLNDIGLAQLSARQVETIALGGGAKYDLLRVEQVNTLNGKPLPGMTQTLWVDSAGQILKTSNEVFGGFETYRTTKEAATKGITGVKFDLVQGTTIRVKQAITRPADRREIVYDLTIKGEDLREVFPNDRRQTLTPTAEGRSGRLVVRSVGPEDGDPGPEGVDGSYLRPNAMITSGDRRVVALASKATEGIVDPWAKAVAVSHWVFQNLKKKHFETSFAPASEVARDLQGDCSEHTVLAAAMLRALGIPCRVVVGLVYDDTANAFGFHMWDEVYVNRRWVAIDPTWDEPQVDAVHLKIVEASLEGISPFESFLQIVRVMGNTTIEPVELR